MREITAALTPLLDLPFAFFGHSLGSIVGFEVVRELRRRQLPLPIALLVSSHTAPQTSGLAHELHTHELDDAAFVRIVGETWGFIPKEAMGNAELLFAVMVPSLRADIK